jgi:cold shock CspA family protein
VNRNDANLLAQKLTRELYRIAQAYGKRHPFSFDDMVHDLTVMLECDGLNEVSLKFHRPDSRREVLAEYDYTLHAGALRFYVDDAQGLSVVPLPPPFEMGLVVNRDTKDGAYEHRLRLNWHSAPDYSWRRGFEHQDGNTTRRTGGRASKRVYVDDGLRRKGNVKFYLPARRYGFITGSDGVDVFFHASNLQGFQPRQGQNVTYLPLVTPRGVQAKDVQPA